MGCCLCIRRAAAAANNDTSEGAGAVAIGRNQPLKPEKPRWVSDRPMTEEQLRSQRDQFWDTAPAFEGHKEIWDALKAAAYALESGDHLLAQAIVNGASIMLPTGSLEDCYDELGTRYQLPVYVLSAPANLVLDVSDIDEPLEKLSPSSKKRKRGSELPIRVQLSSGSVVRLTARTNDTVLLVRQHVAATADVSVDRVRLFFAGKQLTDNARLKDAGLRKNFTMQAVLSEVLLSKPSLRVDVDVLESPLSTEEPSCATVPASTGTPALNVEHLGMLSPDVPTDGLVGSQEPTPAPIASEESEIVATLDTRSKSSMLKDEETVSGGSDTPL